MIRFVANIFKSCCQRCFLKICEEFNKYGFSYFKFKCAILKCVHVPSNYNLTVNHFLEINRQIIHRSEFYSYSCRSCFFSLFPELSSYLRPLTRGPRQTAETVHSSTLSLKRGGANAIHQLPTQSCLR